MNKEVYIFNPEHDLALAFGAENYTPPPMAQCLHRDLQLLPAWICPAGTSIFTADKDTDSEWLAMLAHRYGIEAFAANERDLPAFTKIIPWGWDLDVRKRIITSGANPCATESKDYINSIRTLSHRRISIEFHNRLKKAIPELTVSTPVELSQWTDIYNFASQYPKAYIKAPWSSSGKGVFRALEKDALEFERWCRGILRRQGSVLCEQPLNGILDFALEYRCKSGKAEFCGYSVFSNDLHKSFDSGIVASSEHLRHLIVSTLGNSALLDTVLNACTQILDEIVAPHYNGYVGIDMLIYTDENGNKALNPCIEVNLRHTMGVVTSIIGDRFIAQGHQGTFKIEYHKDVISPEYIENLQNEHPLCISDKKITGGVQMLTPVYDNSHYCAYIIVD